jgi:hypothetical protein
MEKIYSCENISKEHNNKIKSLNNQKFSDLFDYNIKSLTTLEIKDKSHDEVIATIKFTEDITDYNEHRINYLTKKFLGMSKNRITVKDLYNYEGDCTVTSDQNFIYFKFSNSDNYIKYNLKNFILSHFDNVPLRLSHIQSFFSNIHRMTAEETSDSWIKKFVKLQKSIYSNKYIMFKDLYNLGKNFLIIEMILKSNISIPISVGSPSFLDFVNSFSVDLSKKKLHQKLGLHKEWLGFYNDGLVDFNSLLKFSNHTYNVSPEKYKLYLEVLRLYNSYLYNFISLDNMEKFFYYLLRRNSVQNNFTELIFKHHFNIKNLLYYIMVHSLNQGYQTEMKALSDLADYVNMQKKMNSKFEKYPQFLKSKHDIAVKNFETYRKEEESELIKQITEEKKLKIKVPSDKVLTVVFPESTKDIVTEGNNQHNCVASYVDRIIDKKSYILFVRLKKNPKDSLLTVEINDTAIIQVEGSMRRSVTTQEAEYLHKFALKNNLKLEY